MTKNSSPDIADLIGITHCKRDFYRELQRNIQTLEKTNHELQEKRKEMQAVLDGINDLMLVLSEDLQIQQANHIAKEWYHKEIVGQKCYAVIRQQEEACQSCPVIIALQEHRVVKDLCSYTVRGQLRYFELVASPIGGDGIDDKNVLLIKRDVTRERSYQMRHTQMEKLATVGTLAAGIAHEINNPLTSIRGFTQGLQRRISKLEGKVDSETIEDFEEYTETILTECLRCRDIVKNLLTLSRHPESTRSIIRLNQCVGDILFILQHHLQDRHNITVHSHLDPQLPPTLGDEAQIKQVIMNIIINAYDSLQKNAGIIDISTRQGKNNTIELIISDTGSGIPKDVIEKIFDPFFSTKRTGQGTGLGLSTSYSIIHNHKGTIIAENNEEKGARFTISLPQAHL